MQFGSSLLIGTLLIVKSFRIHGPPSLDMNFAPSSTSSGVAAYNVAKSIKRFFSDDFDTYMVAHISLRERSAPSGVRRSVKLFVSFSTEDFFCVSALSWR